MIDYKHVLLDDTAMLAAGRGNQVASRLIDSANRGALNLHATTCALVEAERARSGTAAHFASMPTVNLIDLDLPAALAVARDSTWAFAHTRHAAEPTFDRPESTVVATADPDRWSGLGLLVIDVRPR